MENSPSLIITHDDFQKISTLLSFAKPEIVELLEEELGRAKLVPLTELPKDIVSMNSKVSFIDLDTNKEQEITLVYPHDANMEQNKLSILAPVGAALIGLKVGQTIDWPLSEKKTRRIKVISVSHAD